MKNFNRYVLRKRARNLEENSARKRMKTKSDSEESHNEDFSPPESSLVMVLLVKIALLSFPEKK